jgi:Flp pilus assembly protein TadG
MKHSTKLLKETTGAEIAEAAFVLPLIFLLVFGILWFGRALNIYSTLNRAAAEAAQLAASPNCATCGGLSNQFLTQSTVKTRAIDPIVSAAHLDPNSVQVTVFTPSVALPGPPAANKVVVTLTYPYNFRLNGITCCPMALTPITTGITITAQAQARQED